MSRFDATRTTEVPEGTWTVPTEREGNVIYQHSVWNVDYSKIDAVIIDGVRFENSRGRADDYRQAAEYWQRMYEKAFAERICKQEERGWGTEGDHARVWLTCGHDCMVPTVQDLPNYCPNCGCKVVSE